jgi:GT2 family glycosyltransferase
VFLLNSDTRLKAGSLQALSHYFETHANAAVVGPRIVNPDGTLQTSCFHFPTPLHIFLYLTNLYKLVPGLPILRNRSLQACRFLPQLKYPGCSVQPSASGGSV